MNAEFFETLLFESESDYLDFKQEEYKFENAIDEVKSELLKDVLAFANAWRRNDAYILLGVREIKGGRSEVVGVSKHLEDASLQEFVNSKVNKPIKFFYIPFEHDGKQVGIIYLPIQERPVFLIQNYGKLRKNTVYIRRGSSTSEASPDEIAKMGISQAIMGFAKTPALDCEFAYYQVRKRFGKETDIKSQVINVTGVIPDYQGSYDPLDLSTTLFYTPNKDYFRDLVQFFEIYALAKPIGVCLNNYGQVTSFNTRAEITCTAKDIFISTENNLPVFPKKNFSYIDAINPSDMLSTHIKDTPPTIEHIDDTWIVSIQFGNIQPKEIKWCDEMIYMGSRISQDVSFDVAIFGDNIPDPIHLTLTTHFTTEEKVVTLAILEEKLTEIMENEIRAKYDREK